MPDVPLSTADQLEKILEDKLAASITPAKKPKIKHLPKVPLKI